MKSIRRGAAPFRPDLHGYSCATARKLMLEAFAAELPQMLGPLGEWMGRWKIMEDG